MKFPPSRDPLAAAPPNRREILRGAALLGAAPTLAGIERALGEVPPADPEYRALVCVFLFGGADLVNLLVPRSIAAHTEYANTRRELAEARGSLLPIQPRTSDGIDYGLHGAAPELRDRFEQGDLAFVANVGPLAAPTTRDEYLRSAVPLPQHLFSHGDQQEQWLRGDARSDAASSTGWAGRLADRLGLLNPGGLTVPMGVSLAGPVRLLVGARANLLSLDPEGPARMPFVDPVSHPSRRRALERMLEGRSHVLEREHARVQREVLDLENALAHAYETTPTFDDILGGGSPLMRQLRAVARVIALRQRFGIRRQTFFVGVGDFDTHDSQLTRLPTLFRDLSIALDGFQTALERLGEAPNVTTFTASDFGRTLTGNGRGSDHGWGGHGLVLGGAVRGRDIHGRMPSLRLGGPDEIGEGRLLPSLSIEQLAAPLARWMGLAPQHLGEVLPNAHRFDTSALDLLRG